MFGIKSYLKDNTGNFATITALSFAAIGAGMAAAIDMSNLFSLRSELRDIADAAALSAAIAANSNPTGGTVDRMAQAHASVMANIANIDGGITVGEPIIIFDDTTKEVTVEIPTSRKSFFGGFTGRMQQDVRAMSAASYEVKETNPVSFAFVVDVSGSMGWCPGQANDDAPCPAGEQPRINTLKEAVGVLFDQIEGGNADIDALRDKIRTGAWTYRGVEATSVDMADGWNHVEAFVDGLAPRGRTDSTDAFSSALEALSKEPDIVNDPNLKRFIIFMTDGVNNDVTSTLATEVFCQTAKEQGINIFAIAFSAPIEGENLLLQCASPNDDEEVTDPGEFEYESTEARVDRRCDSVTDPTDGESHGRRRCEREKAENYFDAENGDEFKAAFAEIGANLGRVDTRLTR